MSEILVSVVMPVHNGEKYIRKTVLNILSQSYKNIELILVENASSDNSLKTCMDLKRQDDRIHVIQSKNKGTSLARKEGVEYATGKYIIFSDQDDTYNSNIAIEKMIEAIVVDNVQICQFGHYKKYQFGIIRKINKTQNNAIFSREELFDDNIKGVLGQKGSCFDTVVWNKIYETELLKESVKNIQHSLYFAEDEYLNIFAFFNENLKRVSVRNEAYYVWSTGIGFSSSSNGGKMLFDDYEIVKPLSVDVLAKNKCKEEMVYNCHLESIYFFRAFIRELILNGNMKSEIISKIEEIDKYLFIKEAKKYFNSCK